MIKILILNGPNLNLLGEREPEIYGKVSLDEIVKQAVELGRKLDLEIHSQQLNGEGELIETLHESRHWAGGVIFNPGGYASTSVALHDAIKSIPIPVVEVHLSNIHAREEFRRRSMIAPACIGSISGFGWRSYLLGLHALDGYLRDQDEQSS